MQLAITIHHTNWRFYVVKKQVQKFRELVGADGSKLTHYRRELQNINQRDVKQSTGCAKIPNYRQPQLKYKIIM
jgi:hypothetical protein